MQDSGNLNQKADRAGWWVLLWLASELFGGLIEYIIPNRALAAMAAILPMAAIVAVILPMAAMIVLLAIHWNDGVGRRDQST